MTAARRLTILCAATAAIVLWLAWLTMEVVVEPLEPTLCPVGSADPACVQPVVNRPPDAVDDELRSRPGRTMRANLLSNDSNPDGDTITVSSRLDVKRDGEFTYTPAPGFVGRESFGYAVQDQYGLVTGGRAVIEVVNEAPVAANHRFRIRSGETAGGNLLVGASDPDGDPIRLHPFSVTADARTKEGGLLGIDRDGGFNYLPPAGFVGRDSFRYTIADSHQATGSGTVTIDVAANRPPVAGDDRFTTRPDPLRGNVLGNDVDPDGDSLRVTPVDASVVNGHLVLRADGSFTFTPRRPGVEGGESFDYTVTDGRGGSDVGTVEIDVVNRPPAAVDDAFATSPGHALSAGLIGNDSDPDGDALLTGTGTVTTAAGGRVTFHGDGLFSYRTPAGFVGVDRFEYGLSDGYGARDVGEVTIRVG